MIMDILHYAYDVLDIYVEQKFTKHENVRKPLASLIAISGVRLYTVKFTKRVSLVISLELLYWEEEIFQ